MFLLTKAFELRDKANSESHDKPFLEHLEDLRTTITRIVVTLLIATIACYALKDTLMDLLRRPIEVVWEQSQKERLPTTLTPTQWETAKRCSQFSTTLTPDEKDAYFKQFNDPDLAFFSDCAHYYRVASSIKGSDEADSLTKRNTFIDNLPNLDPKKVTQVKEFLTLQPSVKIDAKNEIVNMRSLKPTETFMLSIKLAFFAGIIVSFPFILIFTLQFVLPGLKEQERKALWPALAIGFGLFLTGVFFCYFLVLPETLKFFYLYSGSMGVENEWRIGEYITFATQFTLIFGLAFELPVVVMVLIKLGLLDYDIMSRTRSYAIVAIFVIAAVITPTGDALTLTMLAAPMTLLYEFCIWYAYFTRKKELETEAAEVADYRPTLVPAPGTEPDDDPSSPEDTDNGPITTELVDDNDDQPQQQNHDYDDDYDHDYFLQDPDQQHDEEGEELDDDSDYDHATLSGEIEPLDVFNNLREAYDPDADDELNGDDEDDNDTDFTIIESSVHTPLQKTQHKDDGEKDQNNDDDDHQDDQSSDNNKN